MNDMTQKMNIVTDSGLETIKVLRTYKEQTNSTMNEMQNVTHLIDRFTIEK